MFCQDYSKRNYPNVLFVVRRLLPYRSIIKNRSVYIYKKKLLYSKSRIGNSIIKKEYKLRGNKLFYSSFSFNNLFFFILLYEFSLQIRSSFVGCWLVFHTIHLSLHLNLHFSGSVSSVSWKWHSLATTWCGDGHTFTSFAIHSRIGHLNSIEECNLFAHFWFWNWKYFFSIVNLSLMEKCILFFLN